MTPKPHKMVRVTELATSKKIVNGNHCTTICKQSAVTVEASRRPSDKKQNKSKKIKPNKGEMTVAQVQLSISDFESASLSSWSDLASTPMTVSVLSESNSDSGIKSSEEDLSQYKKRLAGSKIFASVVTFAWRKRREQCAELHYEVENLKKALVKVQDRSHRIETYLIAEKKANGNLSKQVRDARDLLKKSRDAQETLTVEGQKYKTGYKDLDNKYQTLSKEFEDQTSVLECVRKDLFQAVTENRRSRETLSNVRREIQDMESQKEELLQEIFEMNEEFAERERRLLLQMECCREFIQNLLNEISEYKKLGVILEEIPNKDEQLSSRSSKNEVVVIVGPPIQFPRPDTDQLSNAGALEMQIRSTGNEIQPRGTVESLFSSQSARDKFSLIERGFKNVWFKASKSNLSIVLLFTMYNMFPSMPKPTMLSFSDIWREFKMQKQQQQ